MKIFTLIIIVFVNTSLFAQKTYVPDDYFEQALIDLGHDSGPLNDSVPTDSISSITKLVISNESISSLSGIEDFTALERLYCSFNELTSLDLSTNTALKRLYCEFNELTSLDVSTNLALQRLYCSDNPITSLDLSTNLALQRLSCDENKLTSLDLSKNTDLTHLYLFSNELTSLDLSKNTALKKLDCRDNQLTSLDLSTNTALSYLNCPDNKLTSLDVSNNTALEYLWCDYNQIASLDLSTNTALIKLDCRNNQLTNLDIRNGSNTEFITVETGINPDLTCIYVDTKDGTYLSGWIKNTTSYFVNNEAECELSTTGLSVSALTDNTNIKLYPNPAKEFFRIETDQDIEIIKLYSVSGCLVKTYIKQDDYSILNFQSGVYFINIQFKGNNLIQKLIVE
jgi:hypothetical protein